MVPTATETLSSPDAAADAHGDISVLLSAPSANVHVGYAVAPGAADASVPGGKMAEATLDCGNHIQGAFPLLKTHPSGAVSGDIVCQYPSAGTFTVTLSTTDDQTPAVTITVTHTVTVANPSKVAVDRYDGASRYGTGVSLSQAEFPAAGSAGAVVLARGDMFADALAGIPLAKYKNAPLLLTPGGAAATGLDSNVEAELLRVLPKDKSHTVFILGGTSAIPQAVEDHISNVLGYNVVRLSGSSRYETALAIAKDPRALNNPAHLVVARGDDFADALAAGPYASNYFADHGVPAAIVLSTGPYTAASLDTATKAYIVSKLAAANSLPDVTAIGGGAVAATSVLEGARNGGYLGIQGNDRYETAENVAAQGWSTGLSLTNSYAGLASGMSFPDALTGGAYMAMKNGPLLLTDPAAALSAAPASILHGRPLLRGVEIFGGPAVLHDTLVTAVGKAVAPTPIVYTDHHKIF
ncbi:hypothetical protein GCM10009839_64210 [Catenulispora yoronensis]|uniref:Cell wall-binding repeat-containing protein n=1 Tax=Catenulispora yoronensis TaxID=450799 RepID=A0ABN2V2D1_9ACTN